MDILNKNILLGNDILQNLSISDANNFIMVSNEYCFTLFKINLDADE